MNKTKVKVEFVIVGDEFNPGLVTEKLQINPNEYWVKGDDIKGRNIKRKDSCWIIGTEYEESSDINNQIIKVLNKIQDKKSNLCELGEYFNLEYILLIIINIEENEKPAIYFENEVIQFMNDIKGKIDIDLYIF
ncbi:hypothetical protein Q428_11940 [Fervidicella metallireducens AeB]|uniref:DUF4279 domain-containing protein n=1 Tax=Fervidicella metallireducens AeB TaxID=1403537 RepID=A0A017RSI7_9CLOT|nr:DUF4279 domain-containing protein [Fervidicella metallireducens]EYE87733.1 hypothetical protein Q428_11940 [Fervidicella metallireducens AeB]